MNYNQWTKVGDILPLEHLRPEAVDFLSHPQAVELLKRLLDVQGNALDDWENAQTFEEHVTCHSAYFGVRNIFNLMLSMWSKVEFAEDFLSEEEIEDGGRANRPEAGY